MLMLQISRAYPENTYDTAAKTNLDVVDSLDCRMRVWRDA
jgi:hypothetical protein